MLKKLLILLFVLGSMGCQPSEEHSDEKGYAKAVAMSTVEDRRLPEIWYRGMAELNTYSLEQNRYRDQHPGMAVLVFVTEDFLTDKQVKNDRNVDPKSTGVLKTNFIRRFTTGLYDYSIMTSVFTPTDTKKYPNTLKVTTSVQDWCGQIFMQVNHRGQNYDTQIRSYFESEGDQNTSVKTALMEDELFNRVRMGPDQLPVGDIQFLPGTAYTRLAHKPFRPIPAKARLEAFVGEEIPGADLMVYTVDFKDDQRSLSIIFQSESPYRIEGWIDEYPSAFDKKRRKSIARRLETQWSPYWEKNAVEDASLRQSLGLDGYR